ncbi:MAG: uracil-DNA glycosylase [Verrucomicrobiales bacterium]|nr:uracil-DNA glycosylase [Verrucomicrobiales bacterium]
MAANPGLAAGLGLLAEILEREKARGGDAVPVSPEAIETLRGIPAVMQERRRSLVAAAQAAAVSAAPVPERSAPAVEATTPPAPLPAETPAVSSVSAPAPSPVEGAAERTEEWRRAQLNAIFKSVKQAPAPRELGTLFDTVVFASGNPSAEIVFVGEAPGAEEEKQKKPFVGPAGQKLEQILKAMGLSREEVYISNIVKFRPKKGDGRFQGSSNRTPTQEEMASCLPFIRAEIEVLRPRVIVALGRTAAEGLLEKGGALAAFRNETHHFADIPVIVTYHPSYLLRQEAASAEEGRVAKRQVWEDMLRVMEIVGLPISEKQRRYFL